MSVDPSSLIFVVIIAIWATYLLGHWVRRRDHVATARSVERFSEAMRVLERRPAVRSVPLSRPNPRSYVVAPAGPAPRQVTVKRAQSVARPPAPEPQPAPRPAARPARAAKATGRRPAPSPAPAYLLLGLLVALPVVWLLVAATSVPWVVGAVVTLALVADVAVLRQRARRARELARRRARSERRTASQARRDTRRAVVGQVVASHRDRASAPSAEASASTPAKPSAQAPDVQPEGEPVTAADAAPAQQDDGSWQPVPVPPPTYTLKPKASPAPVVRRTPAPAAGSAPAPDAAPSPAPASEPAAVAVETPAAFDLDEILERRIAAGG